MYICFLQARKVCITEECGLGFAEVDSMSALVNQKRAGISERERLSQCTTRITNRFLTFILQREQCLRPSVRACVERKRTASGRS